MTILSAAGGTTKSGIKLKDTAAVDFKLSFPNATDMQLSAKVNFAASGFNTNQTAIAGNLNDVIAAGGSNSIDPMIAALATLPSMGRSPPRSTSFRQRSISTPRLRRSSPISPSPTA